jgi:hypothetical protein
MNVNIESEAMTREDLINHILNHDFHRENFYRYSIEVFDEIKLIATRLFRQGGKFSITFVMQELVDDSWEDVEDADFIKFIEGNISDIDAVITNEVFDGIVPTMKNKLLNVSITPQFEML